MSTDARNVRPLDDRLLIPVLTLWPDLYDIGISRNLIAWIKPNGGLAALLEGDGRKYSGFDLSRIGASDILARRVAETMGHFVPALFALELPLPERIPTFRMDDGVGATSHLLGMAYDDETEDDAFVVPALADLDPTDDTCLDWGPLGSPRIVDLVALGIVAQHLYAEEQAD